MAEYIEREKVNQMLDELCAEAPEIYGCEYKEMWKDAVDMAKRKLSAVPTVDVRPKILGRWITQYGGKPFCSYCGYNEGGAMQTSWEYCPNCSAEMDGKDNDI